MTRGNHRGPDPVNPSQWRCGVRLLSIAHTWLRAGFHANHAAMQTGMCQLFAETAEWFVPACTSGALTRSALARELCEREGWFGGTGRPRLASARTLLARLAEEAGVGLPEAEATEVDPHTRAASDFADSSVSCPLRELGVLSLEPVREAADRRRREAMIETHHPQGWCRPPGGQVRYWVRSERHGLRMAGRRPAASARCWRRPSRGRRCPA